MTNKAADEHAIASTAFSVRGLSKTNGEQAQILEGLAAGDQVIQHPSDVIEDGAKIVRRGE